MKPRIPRSGHKTGRDELLLGALWLVATLWRWHLWSRFHLREDEALYGYWAWLIYSGIDPMLRTAPVDKPPLFPYLLAWLFGHFTPSEEVARLPNLFWGALSLPLLYGWLRALLGSRTARRAFFLYAAFPLAVLLTPTVYLDTTMVGFLLLSAWAATRRRKRALWALLSGVSWAAAVTTKPPALAWLPLIWGTLAHQRPKRRVWLFWGAGAVLPLWRWFQWEEARGGIPTWRMGWAHYGGLKVLPPSMWGHRCAEWASVWHGAWGWVGGVAVAGVLVWVFWQGRGEVVPRPIRWLSLWWVGMATAYVVTTLAPWDRYLLLFGPVTVALVGWGWNRAEQVWPKVRPLLLAGVLLWGGITGTRAMGAQFPVGGDHGAYDGLDAVVAYVARDVPRGGVVYHHWLGWHYGFYLFGAPYDFRWWPDVTWLAQDAAQHPDQVKVLVLPAWHQGTWLEVTRALEKAGVDAELVARIRGEDGGLRFWIYRLRSND